MKNDTIGHLSRVIRLLAIAALVTCAFAGSANAQSSFIGKFTLPHEVHWGTAVLPAGDYSIRMVSLSAPALVWSANGQNKMFTVPPITAASEKGPACLTITYFQGERMVRSLNLPQNGRSLVYKPLTKAEHELIAKEGQIEAVPVFTAKK